MSQGTFIFVLHVLRNEKVTLIRRMIIHYRRFCVLQLQERIKAARKGQFSKLFTSTVSGYNGVKILTI